MSAELAYTEEPKSKQSLQYYFIKSHLNGMVLDIDYGNPLPGTQVITFRKHGRVNQQWRDDPATGTIRSKLNDFCLDFESGRLVVNPYQADKQNQQWKRTGKLIVNRIHSNIVLDIDESDREQGARVISFQVHRGKNQSWTFEMV